MSLASRIHGHFHPVDDPSEHSVAEHSAAEHSAHESAETHSHSASPFWVRYYDQLAQVVSFGRVDRIHTETLAIAGFEPGQSLLDVGCGTGDLVLAAAATAGLADGSGVLAGLDIEPAMIAKARTKAARSAGDPVFDEGSIDAIDYPDDTFDVVTSSLMFHHLTPLQQASGLDEVFRVLRPGGRLVVVDINGGRRSIISLMPGHGGEGRVDVVQDEVSKQLSAAGFVSVSTGAHHVGALSFAAGIKP